jgi:NitT/TauT family transport system ATP-binding protein
MAIASGGAAAPVTSKLQVSAGEIIVDNVCKSYGTGIFEKKVVKGCSFTIERNKLTVMIGPSGCGKSTLIKPIARGEADQKARDLAEFLLDKVGLRDFRSKYPTQLSGGMQRRAELARAMINNPEVMILDEPFRGLDAMSKELMWEYYSALFEESHRTNFFVTTDIDEALFLADRLIIMSNIPTRVRATIEVNIPRPRKLADFFLSERANEVKMTALSLLHEEAMKSFSGGSKAAADFVDSYARRSEQKA